MKIFSSHYFLLGGTDNFHSCSAESLKLTEKAAKGKRKREDEPPINQVIEKRKRLKKRQEVDPAQERIDKELAKVAAYQARLAKKNNKQKRIKAVVDNSEMRGKQGTPNVKIIV